MNDAAPRVVAPQQAEQDAADSSVRPATLDEFVGQRQLRDNLRVFIEAAKSRGEALDHILFFGPPGLGKTTLAQIVAREMGVDFHATAGPVIQRAADLVAMLSKLAPREVLFIDEIHRLPPAAEEYLYPAMEDYQIDLIIGQGPGARSNSLPSRALHLDRRHDALRPDHPAAAGAFRHPIASRLLRAGGARDDRQPRRPSSGHRLAPRRRRRDCAKVTGHPARRDTAAAPGPRLYRSHRSDER